jgi:hypothetical protein
MEDVKEMIECRDPYTEHIDAISSWYEFLEVLDAWDNTTSRLWDTESDPDFFSFSGRYGWWSTILAKWILEHSNVDPEPLLQVTRMIQAKDPLGEWTAFAASPEEIERRRYEWRPYRQVLVDLALSNERESAASISHQAYGPGSHSSTSLALHRLHELLEALAQRCAVLPRAGLMVLTPDEADRWAGKWSLGDFMFVEGTLEEAALLCDENRLLDGAKRLREYRQAMLRCGNGATVFVFGRHAFDKLKEAFQIIRHVADIEDYARSLIETLQSFAPALSNKQQSALTPEQARAKFCFEQWQSGKTYKEINKALKEHSEWEHYDNEKAVRGPIKMWATRIGVIPRTGHPGRRAK